MATPTAAPIEADTRVPGSFATYRVLVGKELRSALVSPFSFVILAVMLFISGFNFWFGLKAAAQDMGGDLTFVTEFATSGIFLWFLYILVPPLLTMRLVSEEQKLGTLESLQTTPVSDLVLVLSKFTASFLLYAIVWVPVFLSFGWIELYGGNLDLLSGSWWSAWMAGELHFALDWGVIAAAFLGVLLLGGAFLSMGLFVSTLTSNQILAAFLSLMANLGLFFFPFLAYLRVADWLRPVLQHVMIFRHLSEEFAVGIVDSGTVIFYVSLTTFFLFLATRSLERRRW